MVNDGKYTSKKRLKWNVTLGQKQKKKNLLSENILGTGRSLGIT